MSADLAATVQDEFHPRDSAAQRHGPTGAEASNGHQEDGESEEEDDDEDEEEDEPKLKYTKLTGSVTSVYRNGDSTSASIVAGDKMVLGTHNGNVHVLSLPSLKTLKTYHAHSATITSISISPTPPPPAAPGSSRGAAAKTSGSDNTPINSPAPSIRAASTANRTSQQQRPSQQQQQTPLPNTTSNQIYISTSSLDGHVCTTSLLDPKDVQLRNFARPVSAVALSPQYKYDRIYLSGGLAGQLILTTGGKAGVTVDANTNSAAAAASGWLGSIGLAADRGRDEVLHSGEGKISEVKWSLSGKWVVWINEEGIKIMRSHLRLGSEQEEDKWRRIAHASRPNKRRWEEMSGVWRGRAEWVDEKKLETDDEHDESTMTNGTATATATTASPQKKKASKIEKLVVGWGDTAWIMHVKEGGLSAAGKPQIGSADIVRKLVFDCVVSGLTLYTPSLLAILAYRTSDDENDQPAQQKGTPKKGRQHRQTGLKPQLRLVNVVTTEEVDVDELPISRFEQLSAQDYHLGTLYIPPPPPAPAAKTGTTRSSGDPKTPGVATLENFWDAAGGKYATRMFNSGTASILSRSSSGAEVASPPSSAVGVAPPTTKRKPPSDAAHPFVAEAGLKLFISSPFDCVLAVKRDPSDRLGWLLERKRYQEAWELVDLHPEVVTSAGATEGSRPGTPGRTNGGGGGSLADFFADDSASQKSGIGGKYSAAEKEKRRIGDLWLQQLVSAARWEEAGKVAGKVLGTSSRWEHWVWTFAQADRFDEITPYIPSPPTAGEEYGEVSASQALPGVVYEVVLGHYILTDRKRLKELLEIWDPGLGLYDVGSVAKAIESRLESEEDHVREGGEEWRILTECLARLYLADGKVKDALRCCIHAQNADEAFRLLKEEKAMDMIDPEDVPGLLMLRISPELMKKGTLSELESASEEAVQLLVEEAHRGTLMPRTIIEELDRKGRAYRPFLYFYFCALWQGTTEDAKTNGDESQPRRLRPKFDPRKDQGHALVEAHADLAVTLFTEYNRSLLMTFLRASSVYSFEKAASICRDRDYIPELVYVLSKMGQTKMALLLIIEQLGDVKQAIAFAKENPDLWEDLLEYSMDKPPFIKGLLEEVGTSVDPIQLIKRIPEGLEIEGLKEGVQKMMREYDIQYSISEGVARVLRGEVSMGMEVLRAGRGKGVRFEVVREGRRDVEVKVVGPPTKTEDGTEVVVPKTKAEKHDAKGVKPGHCVGCGEIFSEDGMIDSFLHLMSKHFPTDTQIEKETLIGFVCGHVYHLSCLLKANPDTSDPETISRLQSQLRGSADEEGGDSGRSVGAKVAHAHIIKNVLRGGCQYCHVPP